MAAIERGLTTALAALPAKRTEATDPEHGHGAPEADGQVAVIDTATLKRVTFDAAVLHNNRIMVEGQSSPAASAYKMLRTRVLQSMRSNHWSTLAVTSTAPNEGKTLTSINLSLSLARDVNTTTILADMDLRKPSVAKYLGILPDHSFLDVLNGSVPVDQALVTPGLERLGLLLNSTPIENSSDLLASPDMTRLARQLKAGPQRIVVFDMPPLLAADDVLAFAPHVDALLVVLSEGVTTRETLSAAKELIKGFNVIGTVLNRSSEGLAQNYYYYGYS